LQLINDVDPATSSSFSGNYDELVGDLYVALDRWIRREVLIKKNWKMATSHRYCNLKLMI